MNNYQKTIKVVECTPPNLLGLPDLVKDIIYSNRNIKDVAQLDYSIQNLINPCYFKDIDKAIDRLVNALIDHESIVIIGDYDADGATSTSLMYMSLKNLGFDKVNFLIPDRITQGYGLSKDLIDQAIELYQADLLITVDNGISSFDGVDYAKSLGVEVVITDHHLGSEQSPKAVAIINPNQKGCNFPSKNLAGVGVAYYLMKVLTYYIHHQYNSIVKAIQLSNAILLSQVQDLLDLSTLNDEQVSRLAQVKANINNFVQNYQPDFNPDQYLDLVAIGTISDLANLDYNNRILVEQGIRHIRAGTCCLGIHAILRVQKLNHSEFTSENISFKVAPLINAMGRMQHMSKGVECLIAQDYQTAETIACEMSRLNEKRSSLQAENSASALEKFDTNSEMFKNRVSICLFDRTWHQGLIGLNSSIIKDKYWKPTFIFAEDETEPGVIKGSGRSIDNLHIKDCLDILAQKHPDLILQFGGHAGAAGVTIYETNFEAFAQAFDDVVRDNCVLDEIGCETIYCDLELPTNYLNIDFARELSRLGPWGKGFPEPVFKSTFKISDSRVVGKARDTLILEVMDSNNVTHKAIKFKASDEQINSLHPKMTAYFTLSINRYCGRESLNLVIKHLEPVLD